MKTTFKYVNMPKEGKKFGNVVTMAGGRAVFVPGPVELKTGVEYEVTLKDERWGEDDVKIITSVNGQAFPDSKSKGGGGGFKRPAEDQRLVFAARVVAAAIMAGRIDGVSGIDAWAAAAFTMAEKLTKKA